MGGLEYKSSLHCQEGEKTSKTSSGACPVLTGEVGRLVSMLLLFSCKVMSDCLQPHGL